MRTAWLPVCALPILVASAFLLWAGWLQLRPRPGEPVVAVFPPGLGVDAALGRVASAPAGWRVLRVLSSGWLPVFVLRPVSGADGAAPSLSDLGERAGAWLLARPGATACASPRRLRS